MDPPMGMPETEEEWAEYYARLPQPELDDAFRHVDPERHPVAAAALLAEMDRRLGVLTEEQLAERNRIEGELSVFTMWRMVSLLSWLAILPTTLLSAMLLGFPADPPKWFILVPLTLLAVFTYANIRAALCRCPACGKRLLGADFERSWARPGFFTRRCIHCGLTG